MSYCKMLMIILLGATWLSAVQAENFFSNTPYEVCFTPKMNCTELIIDKIRHGSEGPCFG